ncbi:MAG: hypothetical protein P4M12_07465 [Gammaproteobacteria bacterium]|nr:hypothetical protein [Gammaproteobacteria bacterium]
MNNTSLGENNNVSVNNNLHQRLLNDEDSSIEPTRILSAIPFTEAGPAEIKATQESGPNPTSIDDELDFVITPLHNIGSPMSIQRQSSPVFDKDELGEIFLKHKLPYVSWKGFKEALNTAGMLTSLGVAGILIHDYVKFNDKPDDRFDNTVEKIVKGMIWAAKGFTFDYPNQYSFLNHFGETRPDEHLYFVGISAALVAPITIAGVMYLAHTYYINAKPAIKLKINLEAGIPVELVLAHNIEALRAYAEKDGSFLKDTIRWSNYFGGKKLDFQRMMHCINALPIEEKYRHIYKITGKIFKDLIVNHSYLTKLSAMNELKNWITKFNVQAKKNGAPEFPNEEEEILTLEELSSEKNIYGIYASYILWQINKKDPSWKNIFFYNLYLIKALEIALYIASYARLILTAIDKSWKRHYYEDLQNKCNNDFRFNEQVANYLCSICGNWDNIQVAYKDLNNLQKCVSALLQQAKTSEDINEKLSPIINNTEDFLNIVLTDQDWASWSDDEFIRFLDTLTTRINTKYLLNLSNQFNTTVSKENY